MGDSRAIISQDRKLVLETVDHKLANPAERTRIMKEISNRVMILTPTLSKKPGAVPLSPININLDESGHKLNEERQAEQEVSWAKAG